jgi:PKD repeat protein
MPVGHEQGPCAGVAPAPWRVCAVVLLASLCACDGQPDGRALELRTQAVKPTADSLEFDTLEDQELAGVLTGDDDDGDPLTFRITAQPVRGGLQLNANTGDFVYTPTENLFGADSFRFVVNDGVEDSEEALVDLVVEAVNDRPTITGVVDRLATEGQEISFALVVGDVDGDDLDVNYALPSGAVVDGGAFQWTPSFSQAGEHVVAVSVEDEEGASAFASARITVADANRPPVLNAISRSGGVEGESLTFEAAATDPDGDPLFYTWTFGDGTGAAGSTVQHAYRDDGDFTVTVTVSDGQETEASGGTVSVSNAFPVVLAPDDVLVDEGDTVTLVGQATDPGVDDVLSYTWLFGDGAQAQGATASHRYGQNGVFTASLEVSDDDGGAGADTTTVVVNNVAPNVSVVPTAGLEGTQILVRAVVTDPGDDEFTYAWDLTGDGQTDSTEPTPVVSFLNPGVFDVGVAVHDGAEATSAQGTVTVLNVPPVLGAIAVIPANPQEGGAATLSLTSVSEPGSDPEDLNYSWTFGDGDEEQGQGLQTPQHTWASDGTYTVTVTVADGEGEPTTATRQVTVQNGAPSVTAGPGVSGPEGGTVTLTAEAVDPGGDELVWTWNFGDGQTQTGLNLGSVNHRYVDQGVFQARVTVDDQNGGTATDAVTATIQNVAPTVTMDPQRVVAEGTHTFAANAMDPGDRDTLSYAWEVLCDVENCLQGVSFVGPQGGPGVSQVQVHFGRQGLYTLQVVVTDKDGAAANASSQVTVDGAAPELSLVLVEDNVVEGGLATLQATAHDDLPLTWAWDFGDGVTDAVQSSQRQHRYVQDGAYVARVMVTAQDGDSAEAEVQVTVHNGAPTITLAPTTGREGSAATLAATAADPGDLDPLTYRWTFGDGQEETTNLPTVAHTWTADGTFTVSVEVSDGQTTGTASSTATIANVAPELTLPVTVVTLEGLATSISGIGLDAADVDLVWTWDFDDALPTLGGTNVSSIEPTFPDDGAYRVTVTLSDGVDSDAGQVIIEVINRPPVLDEPVDVTGNEGQAINFTTFATDVAADELTYRWEFGDGQGADGAEVEHTFADNGTYGVTVTVTDGDGGTVQNRRLAVIGNVAPTVAEALADQTLNEGQPGSFAIQIVEFSADEVEVCWDFGDGSDAVCGPALDAVDHTWADDGVYTLEVTLTDDDGDSSNHLATVTVENTDPTGTLTVPQRLSEGSPATFLATFADAGTADVITIAWDFEPGGDDDQSGVELVEAHHTYAADGTYNVRLTLTDDDGGTFIANQEVTVANVAPAFQTRPILYVQPGQAYRYDALATDPGDPVVYALSTRPLGMAVADDGLVTWTAPQDRGEIDVQLDASDGAATTAQPWTVQVGYDDRDGDGAPDACEVEHGLDPDDPEDGARDADGDGASNTEECLRGDNPRVQEGPQPPSVHAPLRGAIVTEAPVEMVVNNSPGVNEGRVAFQLFGDLELRELLDDIVVPQGEQRTSWFVDRVFDENALYYWRARTLSDRGNSAWSRPSAFVFSATNDPPPAPTLLAPRGPIQEAFPTFVVVAPYDPELEIIHVELEVKNAGNAVIASTAFDATGGEELRYTLPGEVDLVEDHPYTWRARALDVRRNEGPWSAPVAFRLNNLREAPPAPELLVPADGAVVRDASGLDFVARTVVDPDGDRVVYDFQLRSEGEFGTILAEAFGLQVDPGDDVVVWSPTLQGNLEEDARYSWSVQARDNAAASPLSRGTFQFSADDRPPRQVEVIFPQAGARLASLTEPLLWPNVDDPEGQEVHYTVEIWRDVARTQLQQRATGLVATGPEGTQYAWSGALLEDNGSYHWRVKAIDAGGVEAAWSGLSPFVVDVRPQAPPVPSPLRPAPAGGTVPGPEVELAWGAVTDPEGTQVDYAVEVFDGAGTRIANAEVVGDGAEINWSTPALSPGAYTWRVLSTDGGLTSAWSDSARFTIVREGTSADSIPDAPRAGDAPTEASCSTAPRSEAASWVRFLARR